MTELAKLLAAKLPDFDPAWTDEQFARWIAAIQKVIELAGMPEPQAPRPVYPPLPIYPPAGDPPPWPHPWRNPIQWWQQGPTCQGEEARP